MPITDCWLCMKLRGRLPLAFGSLPLAPGPRPTAPSPEAVSSLPAGTLNGLCMFVPCVLMANLRRGSAIQSAAIQPPASTVQRLRPRPVICLENCNLSHHPFSPTLLISLMCRSLINFLNVSVLVNISPCLFSCVLHKLPLSSPRPSSIQAQRLCSTSPAEEVESIPLPPLSSWLI